MESVEAMADPDEVSSVGEPLQGFFLLQFLLIGQAGKVLEADCALTLDGIVVLGEDFSHSVVQIVEDARLIFGLTAVE